MITQSLEDYLEIIYNNILENKNIKAVDIAHEFGVSRSSVSEALIRLADKDLIIYEGRKGIKITPQGEAEAKKIIKKHKILSDFFSQILGLDTQISNENACKIEHVIDEKVIEQIKLFSSFCIDESIDKKFKNQRKEDK